MELADIKSRDDLRVYWQQVVNRPVWDAAEVEAESRSLLPVAKALNLSDWERYLEAREGYDIDPDASVARLSAFMDWARRCRESIEDWLFAHGLYSLGTMQGKIGRSDDALRNYDELIKDFKQDSDKEIVLIVAKALVNAGNAAGNAEDLRVVGQYLDELRRLAEVHEEPAIRKRLANALFTAFYDAGKSGDSDAVSHHLDELRQLAKDHDEPAIREQLAKALFNVGNSAGRSGDSRAVGQYLNELRELAKAHDGPDIQQRFAMALVNASYFAQNSGGARTAGQHLDDLRQMAKTHDEPVIREQLAMGFVNAVCATGKSDDLRTVDQYLDELRQLAKDHGDPPIRKQLAKALFNHSISFENAKDISKAFDDCVEAEALLQEFSDEASKPLRAMVAIRKNRLRNKLGKPEEYLQESQSVEQHSGDERLASVRSAGTPPTAPGSESDQATKTQAQTPMHWRTRMILAHDNVISEFKEAKERFLAQMNRGKQRVGRFLDSNGRFAKDASVLMVLRQWNSYTPIIVDGQESDRGGGYFVRHRNVGLVIDPGYNFIELFHKAGGKIVDITHVAITHAHDDHTAQLEQLLTMFHQFNSKNKTDPKKVTLLLNHSTLKKFSGFSLHKDCPYIEKVICLNAFDKDNEQTIKLSKAGGLFLTVLPAYHDDVFTMDYAIGLGLRIGTGEVLRRIVFTGDTGLYPLMLDKGKPVFCSYTDSMHQVVKERMVIEKEEEGINRSYPGEFQPPNVDLLVPHLGSIKEYEFDPLQPKPLSSEPTSRDAQEGGLGPMFYPNHLGILGTGMLIKELQPRAVILSEFGSELRGLRMEIATLLRKALGKTMGEANVPCIIPGDPSIVYHIPDGTFLCHEDGRYHPPWELEAKEVGGDRIGLFKKKGSYASLDRFDHYLEGLLNSGKADTEPFELPYMPKKGT